MLFYTQNQPDQIIIVVIICRYRGKWLLVRHRDRNTYEFPGGHVEPGESPEAAARRELYEESGAAVFHLWPVTPYGVLKGCTSNYGMLYFAYIESFEEMPDYEMEERRFLTELPDNLTYAAIQPKLLQKVEKWLINNRTLLYVVCYGEEPLQTGGLSRILEDCHLDRIYCGPDQAIKKVMEALAKDRGLPLQALDWLSPAGLEEQALEEDAEEHQEQLLLSKEELLKRNLAELIKKEDRHSVAISLCVPLLAMGFHKGDPTGLSGRDGLMPDRKPRVLRLEFIDGILIGEQILWKKKF